MDQKTLKAYFDSAEFEKQFHTDIPLGSFCTDGETLFRLWAPTAEHVTLNLYPTGDQSEWVECHALTKKDRGVWEYTDGQNRHGWYYTYDVTVDGVTRTTQDPYSRGCGINGKRSMVVNLAATDPEGWQLDAPPIQPAENIIYEIHVKDFSWDDASGIDPKHRGKFLALAQSGTTLNGDGVHPTGLDYLKTLGITHLELMPIYDFGSVDEAGHPAQFNWGYDPVNYNVPDGDYATDPYHGEVRIRELKQTIQTLHKNGFRVIMDVVYNHTYSQDSCLQRTVPGYYYRQNADGTPSNGSGCGNDTASERSMCAKYILDSVLYWAAEYHMDGFRFDLMGLLTVELMNQIRRELDRIYGKNEKLVFGEPWKAGATAVRPGTQLADKDHMLLLDEGVGAFCDATRDAVKGSLMHSGARGMVNGGEFSLEQLHRCMHGWVGSYPEYSAQSPRQIIGYSSSHDDWTLWDRLVNTVADEKVFGFCCEKTLRANRMAAAILFGCQGNLFLLSGEEFARTKQGIKNTYASPLEVNQLDWNRAWKNRALVDYYRGLFALRKQIPALCDKDKNAARWITDLREIAPGCAQVQMDSEGAWKKVCFLYNTSEAAVQMQLPEGSWQILADGQSSFCWQKQETISGTAEVKPMSALILGRRVQ